MRLRILVVGVLLAAPLAAMAQTPANPDPTKPDFSITVQGTFDPETVAEFNRRVQDYAALRSRLEAGLPPLVVTTNADEIETIRASAGRANSTTRAGRGAARCSLPAMEGQLKRMLAAPGRCGDRCRDHGRRSRASSTSTSTRPTRRSTRSQRCRRISCCCCPICPKDLRVPLRWTSPDSLRRAREHHRRRNSLRDCDAATACRSPSTTTRVTMTPPTLAE